MRTANDFHKLWSIVLAGGEGQRMSPLIERWLGHQVPKQYCTFIGTRSMFQHTLDRSDMLGTPFRRVVVIARSHRSMAYRQLQGRHTGKILLQPANRDTAAGIFLALTYIRAHDPRASVVVYPSDHFIFPEHRFIGTLRTAVQALATWRRHIILIGAVPDRPEPDYGWIQPCSGPGRCNGQSVQAVWRFIEKPPSEDARIAMESGALWNTLVLVAHAETLWELGRRCFPGLVRLFEQLKAVVGSGLERHVLRKIYRQMPSHNFSAELLTRVIQQIAVIELRDVVWSDWGRPERIADVLDALGKRPTFPREYLKTG